MARLKFFVFSLAVLGLWAFHLFLLSPALTQRAQAQAEARVALVPTAVEARLADRRVSIQKLALTVAARPQAVAALLPSRPDRVEKPDAQTFKAFRDALTGAFGPEAPRVVLAVVNEEGSLAAQGAAEPSAEHGLDLAALTAAGAQGVVRDAYGASHLFFSVPLAIEDRGDWENVGTVVVGAPLLPGDLAEAVAKATGADAVAILRDKKVVQSAGSEKAALEKAAAKLAPGTSTVERGAVMALGPLQLPILTTAQDHLGGNAPLRIGHKVALAGTPYEVAVLGGAQPFLTALAEYQRNAVFGFAWLVVLSVFFLFVIGSGKAKAKGKAKAPVVAPKKAEKVKAEPRSTEAEEDARPDGLAALPPPLPAPEASPDDFPFGDEPAPATPAPAGGLGDALFGDAPAAPATPPPAPELTAEAPTRSSQVNAKDVFAQFDNETTQAYPKTADPFELASQQEAALSPEGDGDFNPEATRVAAIPEDLLRQSARAEPVAAAGGIGVAGPRAAPPPVAASQNAVGDDAHFQEVFRDFVRTREQCGEPQDGLTYDKFAAKLRKNKDQLVAKYSCRTVRFQVYVKEGKAALKATPVKD